MNDPHPSHRTFDETYDVVVVGAGFAGCNAAIAAHDAGATVLMLEKMPDPGGISICSGGGVRVASNAVDALAYLRRTNGGTAPESVLQALAEGMTTIGDRIEDFARAAGARTVYKAAPGIYPFPGRESFGFVMIESVPGFDAAAEFPHARSLGAGILMFKVLMANLQQRGIELRLEHPVKRLLRDASERVDGVAVASGGDTLEIGARQAVVLACGGFEADPVMQAQFWQGTPVFSTSFLGNTGDGIRMAQAVGADLWHMWHFHGTYGFRTPGCPIGIRTKRLPDWFPPDREATAPVGGPASPTFDSLFSDARAVRMPWILVDQDGRRFTNEYEPYLQDTGNRALDRYQPETQRFPRIPAWIVADARGLDQFRWGQPLFNDRRLEVDWSEDNRAEVRSGQIREAATTAALAAAMAVDAEVLEATIARWNADCQAGRDSAFDRPANSMMPIAQAPYYATEVWPLVSNTQGGPVHDAAQRVLDPFDTPIAGLYAAGELGSVFGHLYLSGGNLAECFIGGRTAGENAAGEPGECS